ncbi:MAG: orotidine 5'-phosphate decarboxylase / HUMPS family protein, partial [Armatimonadota bacterium]
PDASSIRQSCGPGFCFVTPGIRPAGSDVQDQARVNTPQQAIRAGSDYLVVGRPVTQAPDPLAACHAILDEIAVASGTALQQPD